MSRQSVTNKVHFPFEISGKVQGVYFRKCAKKKADALGIHGWIQNTPNKTVKGEIQGTPKGVEKMKNWLEKEGSPKSRIDKAVFGDEKKIVTYTFPDFSILK